MSLFNVFSDSKLRARQDTLDAQWNALRATFNTCNNTPDAAFPEFSTDYKNWSAFYASESDWSADSNNATNVWQATAKDWADKMGMWGCTGNFDSVIQQGPSGIPGVKVPPPDQAGFISDISSGVKNTVSDFWNSLTTMGWVLAGVVVIMVIGLVYMVVHVNPATAGHIAGAALT